MKIVEAYGQRYPEDIDYYPDDRACVSAAIAYLMFEIDAPEALWRPEAIDRITGRKPGQDTHDVGRGLLALLDHGACLTDFNPFATDSFLSRGLDYLEEFYGDTWLSRDSSGFYQYWNPERLAVRQESASDFADRARSFGERWSNVPEAPTSDTLQLVANSRDKILLHTTGSSSSTHHTRVVLDYNDNDFTVFNNECAPPIEVLAESKFVSDLFLPENGLVVVSGPTL